MVIRCTTLSYYFMPYSIMVYFNNHFGLLVITIFFFLLVMLLWFVDSEVAEAALKGNKVVEECEVEIRPNRVPASCLDENVCLISVQKYFSPDAWGAVCNIVDTILFGTVGGALRQFVMKLRILLCVSHVSHGFIFIVCH